MRLSNRQTLSLLPSAGREMSSSIRATGWWPSVLIEAGYVSMLHKEMDRLSGFSLQMRCEMELCWGVVCLRCSGFFAMVSESNAHVQHNLDMMNAWNSDKQFARPISETHAAVAAATAADDDWGLASNSVKAGVSGQRGPGQSSDRVQGTKPEEAGDTC